ncbi:hypothetical protein Glove_349g128 [Diversispora epigaea]|uniref:Uncharacterized protein n=1 Tax=Diversispora epigaea TaxID=1348612 RepID=A0A397HHY7_9GLOM|nr:hypothetical protein Glove_349g128 [Diversispora epigaea]
MNTLLKFPLELIVNQALILYQTFWDTCHGHSRTLVILKVQRTDEIFGGYNPLSWENSILSRVKKSECAVLNMCKYSQKSIGPYFGGF